MTARHSAALLDAPRRTSARIHSTLRNERSFDYSLCSSPPCSTPRRDITRLDAPQRRFLFGYLPAALRLSPLHDMTRFATLLRDVTSYFDQFISARRNTSYHHSSQLSAPQRNSSFDNLSTRLSAAHLDPSRPSSAHLPASQRFDTLSVYLRMASYHSTPLLSSSCLSVSQRNDTLAIYATRRRTSRLYTAPLLTAQRFILQFASRASALPGATLRFTTHLGATQRYFGNFTTRRTSAPHNTPPRNTTILCRFTLAAPLSVTQLGTTLHDATQLLLWKFTAAT